MDGSATAREEPRPGSLGTEKCPHPPIDALAYLDFPVSHWPKLRTNNCQEWTNREIKRRANVVQVFPSEASLEWLVGAVLLERAREWDQRRYISGERMGDLYDRPIPRPAADPTTGDRARRALEASLELAEGLRAALGWATASDAGTGAYTNNPDTTDQSQFSRCFVLQKQFNRRYGRSAQVGR